jgi:branched-chain amino acid transport system substrate-binding protein
MRTSKAAAALGMALSLSLAGSADAHKRNGPGVTDTEIKIGQTMPYSGPLSAYSAIGRAQLAYFAKINAEGGIHGRRITLLSLDYGYSYPRTVELVRRLVEEDGVLLLFSLLGLSPNTAVHRYANEHGVPQLFVADGHGNWADPARFPWTMGWMPPNRMKARLYARHILRTRPSARIGLLYANDGVLRVGRQVLRRRPLRRHRRLRLSGRAGA